MNFRQLINSLFCSNGVSPGLQKDLVISLLGFIQPLNCCGDLTRHITKPFHNYPIIVSLTRPCRVELKNQIAKINIAPYSVINRPLLRATNGTFTVYLLTKLFIAWKYMT